MTFGQILDRLAAISKELLASDLRPGTHEFAASELTTSLIEDMCEYIEKHSD